MDAGRREALYPALREALEVRALNERQREIVEAVLAGETYQAIGDRYGITRQRVHPIVAQAVRAPLKLTWEIAAEMLREAYAKYGRTLKMREWDAEFAPPSAAVLCPRFGRWFEMWRRAVGPGVVKWSSWRRTPASSSTC